MEKIFLVNVGLNVAYMAAGGMLWERGRRLGDERLEGYGPSLVLQGAFLVGFDTVMFWLQNRATRRFAEGLEVEFLGSVEVDGGMVGVQGRF